MRPIVCRGHTRPLTRVKYNREGDLLFSAGKDAKINAWFSHNGELLGSYEGSPGAVWDIDISFGSSLLLSGGAPSQAILWDVQKGTQLFTWTTNSPVRCVAFATGDDMALLVTDAAMGCECTICIVKVPKNTEEASTIEHDPIDIFIVEKSKVTTAKWGPLNNYIFTGHEDGTIKKWNAKTGDIIKSSKAHSGSVTDLQLSIDKTYFITSSKDTLAKLHDLDLNTLKTYKTPRSCNSGAIHPFREHVILGGGQEASQVTTTSSKQGHFEARFFHKIFEQEMGRVKGHFGPINTISVCPDGKGFVTGGEDGYIRIQPFDPDYFRFKIDPTEQH